MNECSTLSRSARAVVAVVSPYIPREDEPLRKAHVTKPSLAELLRWNLYYVKLLRNSENQLRRRPRQINEHLARPEQRSALWGYMSRRCGVTACRKDSRSPIFFFRHSSQYSACQLRLNLPSYGLNSLVELTTTVQRCTANCAK